MPNLNQMVSTINKNMSMIYNRGVQDGVTLKESGEYDRQVLAVLSAVNWRTPLEFGAYADGVSDDTAAIQACLDASDYVYIPKGTYAVDVCVSLFPKSNQTIVMDPQTVITCLKVDDEDSKLNYSMVRLVNVSNVLITGGCLVGDRFVRDHVNKYNRGHNIAISGGSNIIIRNVELHSSFNDGICIGAWVETDASGNYVKDDHDQYIRHNCKNLKIQDCHIHDFGRSGISNCGCDGFELIDCHIHSWTGCVTPGSIIDFEPDYTINSNNFITGLYGHDTSTGVVVTTRNTDFTMTNSRVDCFQTQIEGDTFVKDCICENKWGCKQPGTFKIVNCASTGFLLCRSTGNVIATDCICVGDEARLQSPVILLEGIVKDDTYEEDEGTENAELLVDASQARLSCYNCVFYSKKSNEGDRSSIFWSEVYSCKEIYFDKCVFNFRNNITNSWRAENIKFNACTFNIDGDTDAINCRLCNFLGRGYIPSEYYGDPMHQFIFTNNLIRIGNAAKNIRLFNVQARVSEIYGNTISVDDSRAIAAAATSVDSPLYIYCGLNNVSRSLTVANNIAPMYSCFVDVGDNLVARLHNNFVAAG